ncbi:MAG: type II secretion system secretin GspD, partial [Pseudohongiella sp.]|nr:type II secretion system secretin GspD [Pseudohongiella sp.]
RGVKKVKGTLKNMSLMGLAIGLTSCAAFDAQNSSMIPELQPRPSPVVNASSGASGLELLTVSDEQVDNERIALIEEINRDGRRSGIQPYRETAPSPVQRPSEDIVALNYEQADLRDILAELADALDISMVIDPTIADKVSLRTAQNRPLNFQDIWPLLRLLVRENGILLEQVGNVWYARKAVTNVPLEITTPGVTGIASRVMQVTPLTHVSSASAIELLAPLLQPDGTVTRIANSNTVAVTATPTQLSRINELLDLIDDDPFQNQGIQLYPLSNASATDVAQELKDLLTLIEGASPAYQVQGLDRINALLVTAPAARGFDEITRWIRILDADRQEQAEQLFQYRVKNLKAVDLATTLTEVFKREDRAEPSGLLSQSVRNADPTTQLLSITDGAFTSTIPSPASGAISVAISANIQVTIVADEPTNSLLIRANPRDYRQLLATISQLDVPPLQVMINAVIAQIVLSDDSSFGVDWSRVLQNAASGSVNNISTGFLPTPRQGETSGLGGLLFNRAFIDGAARVDATLEAIAVNNEVRLLARPSLTVINNMEGLIRIGAEVPVQLGETIGVGGSSTTNIQYRPTGIELNITPRINDDGVINLTIRQELSSVSESSGVGNNPIFENQEIETTVVVRDGENVVLGGLIQSSNNSFNTGVPGLNRVPGLGRLFSYQRDNNERRELFIVLRPEIVNLNSQNDANFRAILSRFQMAAELIDGQ